MSLSQPDNPTPPDNLPLDNSPIPTATAKPAATTTIASKAGWALVWNIVFLPLKAGLSLFVALVIVKLFPRTAYVDLAAITALLSTLGLYIDFGVERALPRFVGQIEREYGRGALRRFIINITLAKLAVLALLSLLIAFNADPLEAWLKLGVNSRLYLAMLVLLLALGALYDISTQVLYSFFKQKVTNLLDVVVTVLNPLLTLAFIVFPFRLEVYGVLLALLITTVISVGLAGRQALRAAREAVSLAQSELVTPAGRTHLPDTSVTREKLLNRFARYAALMYFFNITVWFYDAAYAILIYSFYEAALTVALIRLSYSFIKQLLKTLLTPFTGIQTPLFSAIQAEGSHSKLQAAYASLTRLQTLILVPSAIGAMLLSRNLVELLFLRQSADAVLTPPDLPLAIWVTVLTIAFTFAEALVSIPMVILQVYEHYRLVIFARLLPLAGGLLLWVGAAQGWNAVAAVSIMGTMALGSRLIALVMLQAKLGIVFPWQFLVKVLTASLAFGAPLVALFWLPVNWFITIGAAVVGAVIFGVAFRALGGLEADDKARLRSLKLPGRKYLEKYL